MAYDSVRNTLRLLLGMSEKRHILLPIELEPTVMSAEAVAAILLPWDKVFVTVEPHRGSRADKLRNNRSW